MIDAILSFLGGNSRPGLLPPDEQQQPAAPAGPSFGDRLMAGAGGFFNAPSPMAAIGGLIGGLSSGVPPGMQGARATYAALRARGLSDEDARAAVLNPKMLEALMPSAVPKYDAWSNGQLYGRFNPATGRPDVLGASPEFKTLSPGQTGGYATPPMPSAPVAPRPSGTTPPSPPPTRIPASPAAPSAPPIVFGDGSTMPNNGSFRPVASGGPREPPAGFEWVDPRDTSKGLQPVKGGPATQIPAEAGGRLAMIEAARPAIESAKKYFLDPTTALINKAGIGPWGAATQAIGQATNSFEIGRQRRNVQYAVEAALRTATGAAAPDSEVARYADFYTPSLADTLATRQQKLSALERFMNYATVNIGAGRMPPPEHFTREGTDKAQARAPSGDPLGLRQ